MRLFASYLKEVRKKGKLYFTAADALSEIGVNPDSFYVGIHNLKKKGDIVSPAKGLYIIVPPEDQIVGCIPAEQLVPILMHHWQADYYAGLLTASMYHGASHQKPQVFQVVTNRRSKSIICGQIKIDIIYKKDIERLPTKKIMVRTGYLNVSSPELTAYDLLLHPHHSGGLNNIATVLSELIETIEPQCLLDLAQTIGQRVWMQRLGYILDSLDTFEEEKKDKLLHILHKYLMNQDLYFAPLASYLSVENSPRNSKWKIIENTVIESDL